MAMPVIPFTVIAIFIVLVNLAGDRTNACACGATDQCALQASTKQSTQRSAARTADQCSLTWPNAALVTTIVVPMVIVIVIRMPASRPIVESTAILRRSGHEGHRHQNQENSTRNPSRHSVHIQSPGNSPSFDAGQWRRGGPICRSFYSLG
jgi:hypothetical protein